MVEYIRRPNVACRVCGKPIYRRPVEMRRGAGNVFCSKRCHGIFLRKEHPCVICHKPILAGANKKTCSRSCANVHRTGLKYKIGRPKDKVRSSQALKSRLAQERGRQCERCQYDLYGILQVHHRDRNRANNHLTNLELICPNCHAKEHYLNKVKINVE